jgi:hypothetical protein
MQVKDSTFQETRIRAESVYPKLPDVLNEDCIRLVHIAPKEVSNSIFSEGLRLPSGIEGHTRGFVPNEKLALIQNKEGYGLFTHPQSGDRRFRYGVAVIIDMPNDIHRIFRSLQYPTDNIPTEFIRGAVTRKGQWIDNPNYSANFVYQIPVRTGIGPNRRVSNDGNTGTVATVELLVERDTDVSSRAHDVW